MSHLSLLAVGLFLPLFPMSMIFNRLMGVLQHHALRTGLLLLWPQVGIMAFLLVGEKPPEWISLWALTTSLLYAFRLLAERDMHSWIGFLATSQWSLLWLSLLASAPNSALIVYALSFSIPLTLIAWMAGGLERRFGAAYTYLYGGLASVIPRFSTGLALSVLAAIATPLFPGFFIMFNLLLAGPPIVLASIPLIWLVWSWAGMRLLQGLLIGPDNHTEQIKDSHRGLNLATVVVLFALTVAGLYLSGGLS